MAREYCINVLHRLQELMLVRPLALVFIRESKKNVHPQGNPKRECSLFLIPLNFLHSVTLSHRRHICPFTSDPTLPLCKPSNGTV